MLKNSLDDIAEIQLGLGFKSAVEDLGERGNAYLIQLMDYEHAPSFMNANLKQIEVEASVEHHFLKTGDILLRLRGPVFDACIMKSELSKPCVANNLSAVIRCNQQMVDPHYILWFLNSPKCKHYFKRAEGSNISSLNIKQVRSMPLILPSLSEQTNLGDVYRNWLAQKALYKQLIENGEQYFNRVCSSIQKNNGGQQ